MGDQVWSPSCTRLHLAQDRQQLVSDLICTIVNMNKLLLICLLGAALVALSGAELSNGEQSVSDLSQVREVRAADPGKGKGQGKGKGLRREITRMLRERKQDP